MKAPAVCVVSAEDYERYFGQVVRNLSDSPGNHPVTRAKNSDPPVGRKVTRRDDTEAARRYWESLERLERSIHPAAGARKTIPLPQDHPVTRRQSQTTPGGVPTGPRTRPRQRPDRFLVGFTVRGSCVYGKRQAEAFLRYWSDPMTLRQAERALKDLDAADSGDRAIYELVPVRVVPARKPERGR